MKANPIIVNVSIVEGINAPIVLHPRTDDSPKGRFSTGSTGWQGSDKIMDADGAKYQVNFQIVKVGSKATK